MKKNNIEKKCLISTKIIDIINNEINTNNNFISLSLTQKLKLSSRLITLWYFIYNEQRNDSKSYTLRYFTNINSDKFDKFDIELNKIRYSSKKLIDILEKLNLIEVNNNFSAYNTNKFSKSYKILTDYNTFPFSEVLIDFEKIGVNFIEKEIWIKNNPKYSKQIEDLYNVDINLDEYINWLQSNIGKELKIKFDQNGKIIKRILTQELAYDFINDVLKIKYKNIWVKISESGRFYSSLTNLTSTAIPFIKLNNEKIYEIDVVNCQPLLLSTLINNEQYKKDTESGVFYDKLSKLTNYDRTKTKLYSFKYIFFNNKKLKSGKIYDALNKLYGKDFINQLNNLKDTYENLAIKLQEIESSIFIQKLSYLNCKQILRHDAIFVNSNNIELIKQELINEFKKLNLNVQVKIK